MISSTSSADRTPRSDLVSAAAAQNTASNPPGKSDQISTDNASFLKSALASQPEIRPEEVERATALAADPSYPSTSILRSVASQILASPDLSEDPA